MTQQPVKLDPEELGKATTKIEDGKQRSLIHSMMKVLDFFADDDHEPGSNCVCSVHQHNLGFWGALPESCNKTLVYNSRLFLEQSQYDQ